MFDLVLQLQLRFEPELVELNRLLEDDGLFGEVNVDPAQRNRRSPEIGSPSTPVQAILRLLVIKHLYSWSYEETERFVSDSLVLRQFCRLNLMPTPDVIADDDSRNDHRRHVGRGRRYIRGLASSTAACTTRRACPCSRAICRTLFRSK